MQSGTRRTNTALRVGLMGGTFDPPHYAHLEIADRALEEYALDRVLFLPNGRPPHKPGYAVSPAEQRYIMTELACADHPRFFVSRVELDRPGPSYSLHTVRELKDRLEAEIFFLVGMDSALEMSTWYHPDELLAEATVVAAPRPGAEAAGLREALGNARASKIRVLTMPLFGHSSTEIRERVREGRSVRYLLPPAVEAYIHKQGLYQEAGEAAGACGGDQ
jgi:nicotinate-nucleotide adenylyltransferase